MSGGLSASSIKSWFQYRCERKTRYEMMAADERAAVPVLEEIKEAGWALIGNEYEERVVNALAARDGVLRPGRKKVLDERLAAAFLRGQRAEPYATQVNLRPTARPAFLSNLPLDLKRTFADLVHVDRSGARPVFQVIDIKATRKATAFHKTQVAFYARMLEAVLRELAIDAAIHTEGQIWRVPDNGTVHGSDFQPDSFALAPYLRMVDEFCGSVLPHVAKSVVTPETDGTFYHIYFKCEQCHYLKHCLRAISPELPAGLRDISAVPGLTHESKRSLQSLGIRTVEQLAAARGITTATGVGWALQRRADAFRQRARALLEQRILRTAEEHTFLMPPRVEVALYLVVDHDPVDNTLAALGYSLVRDGTEQRRLIEVIQDYSREAEAEALCRVFAVLLADLNAIDRHNQAVGEDSDGGLRTHIFFYEAAEVVNLHQAVARNLDDDRIRGGLLDLVRLFPPEELVPEPEFRGAHHLPATAIRNVVEQLYALPATVSYDLRQVSAALAMGGRIARAYEPAPGFERPFSSLLSIDVIRRMRSDQPPSADLLAAIKGDVAARLDATRAVVDWLFAENESTVAAGTPPVLLLNKKPFQFHKSFDPLNAGDLDVLQALELLENRAGMLETLISLAQPAARRRDAGRCLARLRLVDVRAPKRTGRWMSNAFLRVSVPPESQGSDLKAGDFDLILTDDDPDIRLSPAAWSDCRVSIEPRHPGRSDELLTLSMSSKAFESERFQRMLHRSRERPTWHVDRCFRDVNTPRAAAFIKSLNEG
ncbi:hypothetical protein [Azospirillum brasilense]|uniref:hypothetical protein n=1 Tax=Azospirillum brasilense TaxID=192 RepID=UPI001EDBE738|nr:hypothetical protein [Azospirillum brasilense]UKJ75442.1 hypothetical protein H1Q64_14395 [Azospirillum brasilense]